MKCFLPYFAVLSIPLFAYSTVAARKDPGRANVDEKLFVMEFETGSDPRVTVVYRSNDMKPTEEKSQTFAKDFETGSGGATILYNNGVGKSLSKEEKIFVEDFETESDPGITILHNNIKQAEGKSLSEKAKNFVRNFETGSNPGATILYNNDIKLTKDGKNFVKNFETGTDPGVQWSTTTRTSNKLMESKGVVKNFQPRTNVE